MVESVYLGFNLRGFTTMEGMEALRQGAAADGNISQLQAWNREGPLGMVQGFKTSKPTFSDTLLPPRPHILTLLAGPPTGDQIHKCLDTVGGRSFKPPSWSTGRCDEFSETQKQCFTQDLVMVFTFSCFSFKFIQHKATSPPSLWWLTLSRSTGASELEFHSWVSRSLSFSVSTQGHSAPSVGAHSSPLF